MTLLTNQPGPTPGLSPPGGTVLPPRGGAASGPPPGSNGRTPDASSGTRTHTLSPGRHVASIALMILAAVFLGFALYAAAISSLHQYRAQHTAYADFRKALANATAPIGATRPGHPNQLLAPGTAMAVLHIPRLHLREVVFEGTTGTVLQKGPGHLRDTPYPGQAGISEIMGRVLTYGGPFGDLSTLDPGDKFTVTTGQGTSTFRVLDLRRGGDPQPAPLAAGGGRLILATADGTPFVPSGVLRVDADLTSKTLATPPMPLTAASLSPAEQALGTDSSAWVPLVLWGQGLVIVAGLLTFARLHWGRWQIWIVAVPMLLFFGLAVADQFTRLLPNLM